MSDDATANTPEEPDPAMVEALAKQLFRAENPSALWDTKLFDQAGRSTAGMTIADKTTKDGYLKRAHETLLTAER